MKKSRSLIAGLFCAAGAVLPARAAVGTVTAVTGTECSDYLVVDTGNDTYALLEWYGGHSLDKGDKLSGTFGNFGVETMSLVPGGEPVRVYIEDYDLSQDKATDKLKEKCG